LLMPPIDVYKVQWSWNKDTDRWLRKLCIGRTLNICSGNSQVGDIRVDVNQNLHPDIIADAKNLPFRALSFDTVVCDPPFSFYNRFSWIIPLADIARQRLILSTPLLDVRLSKRRWKREIYITTQHNIFARMFQVFTRKDRYLEEFQS